ncbi:MAG: anthranilate synthase component I [Nitrospirota bacterium]
MYYPNLKEFCSMAKRGNLIPVYKEILADLETPVSALMKIDNGRYSYLLESLEGGEKWARYSFLGANPSIIIKGTEEGVEIIKNGTREIIPIDKDPLSVLKEIMSGYRHVEVEGLPRFFGGAVGYIGYDTVRYFEDIYENGDEKEGLGLPDMFFIITDTILIFDNLAHKIKVVSNAHIGDNAEEAYNEAVKKIDDIIARLKNREIKESGTKKGLPLDISSNMKKEEYKSSVIKAKEYIASGDIIQVVLSQRFRAEIDSAPFDIYRALRVINPSPYMYYLHLDDISLVGSSPEVLVRCEDKKVEVRPIAGTRKRGKTKDDDERLMTELLSDEKEKAEHTMLVDLGRNDVGRVSDMGKVKVDEFMIIERYSHVMHIVSHVIGQLKDEKDVYDVMKACFPAGTVSGAPKIRAMEIIEELEPVRRGPYAGAVGYFSFSGNMDTCINIRTIITKGKEAFIQAGAGIVADSNPEREYDETVNKAKAMMAAIEMAENNLE